MRRGEIDRLTHRVIGAAIAVHRELGPGLLESSYQAALAIELEAVGVAFRRQQPLRPLYRGVRLDCGYRLDFVIEDAVVLELKAVEALDPIHTAQMLTYLRHSGYQLGLLINFNVPVLRQGIRRLVLDLPEHPPRPSAPSAPPR